IFSILAYYYSHLPYLVKGERARVKTLELEFYIRALPYISKLYSIFYINRARPTLKTILANIYKLLTLIALAHLIIGDGSTRDFSLTIYTNYFIISDIVRLINVLIIRYSLNCTL
ncbi:homing endonuclease, partial [Phyllosticta citribraziliensis]